MNDLISRQAAIDETWKEPSYTDPYNVLTEVRERIQSLQSAQPEIIRCKDCKHYYFADNRVPSEQSWVCDAWGVDQTAHMGYCFKAERKDNGRSNKKTGGDCFSPKHTLYQRTPEYG